MASFFGEVLPVRTRYGDEDEDELISSASAAPKFSSVIVHWAPEIRQEIQLKKSVQCSKVVIAIGQCGKAFKHLKVHEGFKNIGTVICGVQKSGTLSQTGKDDKSCFVYRKMKGSEQICLVLCPMSINEAQTLEWAKNVLDCFDQSVKIIVVSTSHVTEFKTDLPPSELVVPFVASLKTENWTEKLTIAHLLQPNIITGLPAQILTLCQVLGKPAALFHLYRETQFMDNVALAGFKKLLHCLPAELESHVDINKDSDLIQEESLYI